MTGRYRPGLGHMSTVSDVCSQSALRANPFLRCCSAVQAVLVVGDMTCQIVQVHVALLVKAPPGVEPSQGQPIAVDSLCLGSIVLVLSVPALWAWVSGSLSASLICLAGSWVTEPARSLCLVSAWVCQGWVSYALTCVSHARPGCPEPRRSHVSQYPPAGLVRFAR